MIEVNDILTDNYFSVWCVIDVQEDYVIALLRSDIDGPVDQEEDNIGEFILKNDILY